VNERSETMARLQYVQELESLRHDIIRMGSTAMFLLGEAFHAVSGDGAGSTERASELESQTDHQLRTIRDQCLRLITLQAPVARDARLITGILDAIVDLELIGDYAYEIVTIGGQIKHRPSSTIMNQIADIVSRARGILSAALGGWSGDPAIELPPVEPAVAGIRAECHTLYDKLSQLASAPGDAMPYVNLLLICRHLERISRHAACVAEQAAGAAPMSRFS
jgi:phosphate transport system protein